MTPPTTPNNGPFQPPLTPPPPPSFRWNPPPSVSGGPSAPRSSSSLSLSPACSSSKTPITLSALLPIPCLASPPFFTPTIPSRHGLQSVCVFGNYQSFKLRSPLRTNAAMRSHLRVPIAIIFYNVNDRGDFGRNVKVYGVFITDIATFNVFARKNICDRMDHICLQFPVIATEL
ncbi:hypothetical protein JHK84_054709 [Glycine max]|nr:hypothetical protein JHK84_054709 [Glycine max]